MFQDFDDPPAGAAGERVAALRQRLAPDGLAGFVVPRADEHQNEYVPPAEERLAWLTGFTGSAGSAVVLRDKAALFVDGRYTLQAANQVDGAVFEILNVADTTPEAWLEANLAAGDRLGYVEAVESVLESFETRDAYLEDVPVADTVIVLQALAARRDLAADLSSPLIP